MLKSSYVLSMVSYALSLWISLLKSFCCKEVPTTQIFGKLQQPHPYLIIETASFKLGYNWNHLGNLEEFKLICIYYKYFGNYHSPNHIWGNWSNLIRIWV